MTNAQNIDVCVVPGPDRWTAECLKEHPNVSPQFLALACDYSLHAARLEAAQEEAGRNPEAIAFQTSILQHSARLADLTPKLNDAGAIIDNRSIFSPLPDCVRVAVWGPAQTLNRLQSDKLS